MSYSRDLRETEETNLVTKNVVQQRLEGNRGGKFADEECRTVETKNVQQRLEGDRGGKFGDEECRTVET